MNVRKLAYRILRRFERDGRFPSEEVRELFSRLKDRDRSFLKELVWGVLRRQIFLDWVLDRFLKNPDVPPGIRVVLRMGAYQVFFMDSVPDYAAVSESVSLVEDRNFRKLVNAVLRKVAAKRNEFEPEEIHVKYSHPKWIAEYLVENYGFETAIRIMESHLKPSPMVFRANTLRFSREDLIIMMEEDGIAASPTSHSPHGIVVKYNGAVADFTYEKNGLGTFQGESSQIVGLILDPQPGWKVLDLAAGFGGKSTHLAQMMKNSGKIVAIDDSFEKIEVLNKRAKRLGVDIIETAVMDGRDVPGVFKPDFDGALLDAPCSSLGTARKNPDVLLTFQRKSLKNLLKLQRELLEVAVNMVRKGGVVVYATCTFLREENEGVVRSVIQGLKDVRVLDVRERLENFGIDYVWDGVGALMLPDETLTEFYVSALEKR